MERGTHKCSVKELSERAQVNRATFYLHYKDTESIGKDIADSFAERVLQVTERLLSSSLVGAMFAFPAEMETLLDGDEVLRSFLEEESRALDVLARTKTVLTECIERYFVRSLAYESLAAHINGVLLANMAIGGVFDRQFGSRNYTLEELSNRLARVAHALLEDSPAK